MTRVIVGAAVSALMVAGVLFCLAFTGPTGTLFFLGFGGVGAYLAIRRPSNSIGWLLIASAWGLAVGGVPVAAPPEALLAGDVDAATQSAVWANAWGWGLAFIGFLGLTLVFPTGQLPAGRARWPSVAAIGVTVGLVTALAIGPIVNLTPVNVSVAIDVPNPYAVMPDARIWDIVPEPTVLWLAMFATFVSSVVGLLVRWRRSTGLARVQYRWLVAAIVLLAVATAVWAVATILLSMDPVGVAFIPVVIAYLCVPISIAIAVLRYRLYDIDRVISRTIGWALVTGVLVTVFVGGVLALQGLLSGFTQGQTLAVAASTLVAFALFQPVRRRVQGAVDRRFDRARYDAERTAAAFAERLRHEVDLATLRQTLVATTDEAVRPVAAAVWLRTHTEGGR